MALWESLEFDDDGIFGPAAATPEGRLYLTVILRALYDANHIRQHLKEHPGFWVPRLSIVEPTHSRSRVPRLRYEKILFTIHGWVFDDVPVHCNPCWIANYVSGDPDVFLHTLRRNWERPIEFVNSHRVVRRPVHRKEEVYAQ